MSGIQKLVYSIEAGGLRVWVVRVALAALVVGIGAYYAITQFNGFNSAEAMDLAQIARQVNDGNGFSTKFVRPLILKEHGGLLTAAITSGEPIPELVQPPAYPTLLAILFTVTGPALDLPVEAIKKGLKVHQPEKYVLGMNVLLLLVSGVIFYLWMARAFDNRVATFATVLFFGSDLMWSMAISGLPTQFMIALVCMAGFCLNEALMADETVEGEGISMMWLGIAALMVGVLVLTRYSMLAIYLPFAVLGFMGFTRKTAGGLIATLIPLAVFLPWLIRNAVVSGNLFGYAWVELFADNSSLWRIYSGETSLYVGFNQLIRGLLGGISNCSANLGTLFGGIIIPAMFVLGFFHMFKRDRIQLSRWFWGVAFLLLLGFNATTIRSLNIQEHPELNSLFVLVPALIGYGAAFVCVLVERLQLPSRMLQIPILALVCLWQLYPLGLRLIQHRPPPVAYPPYIPVLIQTYFKHWLEPREIQTCDMPWAAAWYSDRLSLWLPQNVEDFSKLNRSFPISSFWLTPVTLNSKLQSELRAGEYGGWGALIEQLDTVLYLGKKDQPEYKTLSNTMLQALSQEHPMPYFVPIPFNKTDYYCYFTQKRQVLEFLKQVRESP